MSGNSAANRKRTVVGKITSVYGVKGWVKVFSFTQPKENISNYKVWRVSENASKTSVGKDLLVESCKVHGQGLVAKLKGYGDRDEAKALSGLFVSIEVDQLPDLQADDYYWHQLEGLRVQHEDGSFVGKVSHLMETGSNDVMVVKPCKGSVDKRERLIPYLFEDVVKSVSLTDQHLIIDWDLDF